jgi:hypothetical protein
MSDQRPEKEFANGIWFKEPSPQAPDFVIGAINILREDFMKFLAEKEGDYVKLKVLRAKASGKLYCEVDNWKPNTEARPQVDAPTAAPVASGRGPDGFEDLDIPF